MNVQTHMRERISQRVHDVLTQNAIYAECVRKAQRCDTRKSYAVLVGRVPESQGRLTYDDDGRGISNGTLAVIIVRDGRIVTFMWRRIDQPWTTDALRVDEVVPHKMAHEHGKVQ